MNDAKVIAIALCPNAYSDAELEHALKYVRSRRFRRNIEREQKIRVKCRATDSLQLVFNFHGDASNARTIT